jgi:hypothetical protein
MPDATTNVQHANANANEYEHANATNELQHEPTMRTTNVDANASTKHDVTTEYATDVPTNANGSNVDATVRKNSSCKC